MYRLKINFVGETMTVSLGLLVWECRETCKVWPDSSPRRDEAGLYFSPLSKKRYVRR